MGGGGGHVKLCEYVWILRKKKVSKHSPYMNANFPEIMANGKNRVHVKVRNYAHGLSLKKMKNSHPKFLS